MSEGMSKSPRNHGPALSRRALLKGLMIGGGAALWSACAMRDPAPQVATAYPTATPYPTETPYPIPSLTPTPDLSPAIEQARAWFTIDDVVGMVPLKPGSPYGQALVAQVGGRQRAVTVTVDGQWVANVPRLADTQAAPDPKSGPGLFARQLADLGYGIDLKLSGSGATPSGFVGTPDTPGVLRSNCYGDLFELSPTGAQTQVRWLGNAWAGGLLNGSQWQAPVPTRFDGTEKWFTGNFLLTCDDCLDETKTLFILGVGEGIGAKMTFFPNTPYVKQFPDLFRAIVAGGHEIGFHTTTHSNGEWSPDYLETDCAYFEKTVREITGQDYRVVTARPPYGLWYKGGWQDWVESKGLVTAMWSRTIGWDSSPKVIRRTITENGGLILLSHPNEVNIQWYKDNADLIKEFTPRYHWPTITQVLLKDWQPVKIVGLPVGMIAT